MNDVNTAVDGAQPRLNAPKRLWRRFRSLPRGAQIASWIGLVLLIVVIGGGGGAGKGTHNAGAPQPASGKSSVIAPTPSQIPATPSPSPTKTPKTPQEAVIAAIGGLDKVDQATLEAVSGNPRDYVIRFHAKDSLTKGLIRSGLNNTAKTIFAAVHSADPGAQSIAVRAMFNTRDAYGNAELSQVYFVELGASTLAKINWKELDTIDLSVIADQYMLLPDLAK